MIEFVHATKEHAEYIQDRLHPEHAREMEAYGLPRNQCLVGPLSRSTESYTALVDGEPTAMWGLEPPLIIGPIAFVWMLGTEKLARFGKTIAHESRVFIQHANSRYSILECHVDPSYKAAMRWVRWLGFYSFATVQSVSGAPIVVFRKDR